MTDTGDGDKTGPAGSVGARLTTARVEQGLSIDDIAMRTRIPRRHLEAIERGDGLGMPGTTYAIGFAKSYARAVGLDPVAIAAEMRAELDAGPDRRRHTVNFEPADPSRVPPRLLAIVFVILAILFAGGYGLWRSGAFGDNATTTAQLAAGTSDDASAPVGSIGGGAPARATSASSSTDAPVAIAAIEPVWLKVYEMGGATLFQGEMKVDQRFDVPATAVDPRLRTGRPQAVRVTVGSTVIGPLGEPDRIIRDVSLKAASLTARPAVATAAAGANGAPGAPMPPESLRLMPPTTAASRP